MRPLLDLVDKGGWVMIAIVTLSVVLYSRCFALLLSLRRIRRNVKEASAHFRDQLPLLRWMRDEAQETFRQQRMALGAMIAAAPLLGLLGTVSGMEKTFESLSSRAGDKSMEGLAGGISEVLVATESGLAVAIPALLLVYLAHRQVHKHVQALNHIERNAHKGAAG
jgi:biopolymer transport protein ExbB